jgi:rhodanese-related sulfurtransferase
MRTFGFTLTLLGLWVIFSLALYLGFGATLATYILSAIALAGIIASSFMFKYYGWPYADRGKYLDLSAQELKEMLGRVEVIDVRTKREYRRGHIPGSKQLSWYVIRPETFLHGEIVFVSKSGIRSRMALRKVEADRLYNLRDGINGWMKMGFEIERKS